MRSYSISILSVALLAILLPSLAVSAAGTSFSPPANLGPGLNPNVQSAGNNVYVAWTDKSGGIMFRSSSDGGHSWNAVKKVGGGGQYPIMAASGSHVYIVWSSGGINFVSSTDNGKTWSKAVKLSPPGAVTPFIAADGSHVSVVYVQSSSSTSFVTTSSNSGGTWTTPFQFSSGPEPQVAVSGMNVYVMSDGVNKAHVEFAVSHDSGKSFTSSALAAGSEPWIVATGSKVYAAWETKGKNSEIWFLSSSNSGSTLSTKVISSAEPDSWNPMIQASGSKVWVGIQELGGQAQNWILTSTNDGSSFTAKSLTGTGHKNGYVFNIATTDGTNVFAMWLQQAGSAWNVMVGRSSNGDGSWTVSSIGQSDANNDVAIGSIAANGGHGFAAWQHSSAIWFSYV